MSLCLCVLQNGHSVCVLICILVCLLLPRRGPADRSRARHHEAAGLARASGEITLHHSQPGWAAEEMHTEAAAAAEAAHATAETV